MDLFIVGAVTFFVLLISALVWSSQRAAARRRVNNGSFLTDPDALLRLQLEEILATKGLESKDTEQGSFEYEWKDKEAFEAAKSGETTTTTGEGSAAASSESLPRLLLARSMELARHMTSFDTRLGVIVESYGQQVPRETVMYLNGVSGALRAEAAAIATEADALKAGWGATIMRQAMDLTVGLERRKEARINAETGRTQPTAVRQPESDSDRLEQRKVKEREQAAKKHEQEQLLAKQKKEADRVYRELMGESDKKAKSQKK